MTRSERAVWTLLVALAVTTVVLFYSWWFSPSNLPGNFTGAAGVVDLAIYACLTLAVSHRIFMDAFVWWVSRRIEPIPQAPAPDRALRVAFITTFVPGAEGIDLLATTLPAMVAADHPHDVWLLDEGDDDRARELAESLGVHYFTRHGRREYNLPAGPFLARTKGGNHNAWYDVHGRDYDVVAQIDTDFVPRHDFLTQTVGHFSDPGVGWVVTPQIYGNTDHLITLGAAQQQYTFYGPVLRGLSGMGMANMLGANHVVRVRALDDIGHYAGHVTEDLLTGMRLHSKGWRSVYVPLPLAVGEGPDTWRSYFAQQRRWAFGCIEILRNHTPGLLRPMPRRWRAAYWAMQQGYFSGVAASLGLLLLVIAFLGGLQVSHLELRDVLVFGTPLFVMRHVLRLWLQRFNVRPEEERGLQLAGGLVNIAVMPVYFSAAVRVFRQLPLHFAVTPKGGVARISAGARSIFRLHLMVALISAACLAAAWILDRHSIVLELWAAGNVVLFGGLYMAAPWVQRIRFGARRRCATPHPVIESEVLAA